jgi:hypothetical protein
MGRILTAASLLLCAVPAQSVTISNNGPHPWFGWHRFELPSRPAWSSGWTTPLTETWVLGDSDNEAPWPIDLRLSLAPGEVRTVNIGAMQPVVRPLPFLPADPMVEWFGVPEINGVQMAWDHVMVDGASVLAKCRASWNEWHVSILLRWYPEVRSHIGIEARVFARDWQGAQTIYTLPDHLRLRWGDATILPGVLMPSGAQLQDGELLILNCTAVWPRLMQDLTAEWGWAMTRQNGNLTVTQ